MIKFHVLKILRGGVRPMRVLDGVQDAAEKVGEGNPLPKRRLEHRDTEREAPAHPIEVSLIERDLTHGLLHPEEDGISALRKDRLFLGEVREVSALLFSKEHRAALLGFFSIRRRRASRVLYFSKSARTSSISVSVVSSRGLRRILRTWSRSSVISSFGEMRDQRADFSFGDIGRFSLAAFFSVKIEEIVLDLEKHAEIHSGFFEVTAEGRDFFRVTRPRAKSRRRSEQRSCLR